MKLYLCLAALAAVLFTVESKRVPPKVHVYTRDPGEFGKKNTLICRGSEFHPPDITLQLLKNGEEIPGAKQTDLSFGEDWNFHLSKHVEITPMRDEKYSCRVTHGDRVNEYHWEPNM